MARARDLARRFGLAVGVALSGCSLSLDFSAPVVDAAPGPPDLTDAMDTCATNEPNDELASATPIEAGATAGSLCAAGDRDVYRFAIDGASDLDVALRFRALDGRKDLELALFQGDVELVRATGPGDEARIVKAVAQGGRLAAGDYALVVSGRDDAVTNDYVLELRIDAGR